MAKGSASEVGLDTKAAIDAWYVQIFPQLKSYAKSIGVQHNDAEDRVQDAVLRVLVKDKLFFSPYHLQRYICTTIYRCNLNAVETQSRKPPAINISSIFFHQSGSDEYCDSDTIMDNAKPIYGSKLDYDPMSLLINSEMSPVVHKAFQKLPLVFQEMLTLAHIDELSYEEVSRATGLSMSTVRSRLHKASRQLRIEIMRLEMLTGTAISREQQKRGRYNLANR